MDGQMLNSKASQDTFISLLQLDPAPMETPPLDTDTEKALPALPESQSEDPSRTSTSRSTTTSSIGLSGGGHGAIYYLTRIQRYSSYTLAIFTSLHFSTTSIIPLLTRSVPASESYLLLAREIYQTPLSEPFLVLVPVIAHVGAGIALRLLRRDQNLRRYGGATPSVWAIHHARRAAEARTAATSSSTPGGHPSPSPTTAPHHVWPPLSYISMAGYTFAVLVSAHAFLNRGLPLAVEGDSANIGLAYVGHGFARHGALAWLAYGSLLAAGCGHMVWGCAKWLGVAQAAGWSGGPITGNAELYKRTRRPKRTWLAIHGVAILLGGLWAAGGLGVVANSGLTLGWVGEVYDGLYERVGM